MKTAAAALNQKKACVGVALESAKKGSTRNNEGDNDQTTPVMTTVVDVAASVKVGGFVVSFLEKGQGRAGHEPAGLECSPALTSTQTKPKDEE